MIADFFGEPVPPRLRFRRDALRVLHEQVHAGIDVCRHGSKLGCGGGKPEDQVSVVGRLARRRQAIDQTGKVRTLRDISGARQRSQADGVMHRQANRHLDNPMRLDGGMPTIGNWRFRAPILREASQQWRPEPRLSQ